MVKKIEKKIKKEKKSEKKTGKKINEDAILIKKLLDKKIRPIDIANEFNISKQKVNYWKKTEIKTVIHRRKKLDDKDIQEIIKMAENQTTSNMGCRKIPAIMNTPSVVQNTEIPDTAAASLLPPTAYIFLPNFVLFQINHTTMIAIIAL